MSPQGNLALFLGMALYCLSPTVPIMSVLSLAIIFQFKPRYAFALLVIFALCITTYSTYILYLVALVSSVSPAWLVILICAFIYLLAEKYTTKGIWVVLLITKVATIGGIIGLGKWLTDAINDYDGLRATWTYNTPDLNNPFIATAINVLLSITLLVLLYLKNIKTQQYSSIFLLRLLVIVLITGWLVGIFITANHHEFACTSIGFVPVLLGLRLVVKRNKNYSSLTGKS